MKTCCQCKQALPESAFSKLYCSRDGLQYNCKNCQAQYRATHREQKTRWNRAHYQANRERLAAVQIERRRRDPEGMAATQARYRARHPDKRKASVKAWEVAHPDEVRERSRRHRHLQRAQSQDSDVTVAAWLALVAAWDSCCAYCGQQLAVPEQDHVRPIVLGGKHMMSNLLPACRFCNASKAGLPLSEWRRYRRLLSR